MPRSLTGITGWLDKRFYSNLKGEGDLFFEYIERYLTPQSVVLDAGCGRGSVTYNYKDQVAFLCGCDLTPLIGENTNVHGAVVADLSILPFPNASFDVVFSRYVLEHLCEPHNVFREIARILKPDGHLIVLTPNAYHYVGLISRLTPHVFHERIARTRGNLSCATFPTFYRANTRRQLTRLFSLVRLKVVDYCAYEVRPNYLIMSPVTFAAGILYERLVNQFNALSFLRVSIIAVARKVV